MKIKENYSKNFNIIIANDYEDASVKAAEIYAAEINKKPNGNFGFATGGTPVGLYKQLILMNKSGKVDFAKVNAFNLDEYCPIEKSNAQSYDYFMKDELFNHVNIDLKNTHIPNGEAKNVPLECENYDKLIEDMGGIDLQLLGIGLNGHIAFNEPDVYFSGGTTLVNLTESTIEANKRFFEKAEDVPKMALTMGIKTIMLAKKILIVITGAAKADIVKAFLDGKIVPSVPASILQVHPDVTVVLDKAAAAKL